MARKLKTNNGKYNMGLLDFFKNQPQMADPHANARRLMGGAVQAQPMAQPAVQPQSLLPQGTPQEPSMTPYQQPQNIGSGVMGYNRDLTGINNVGHQAGPETQTYLTANGAIDNRNVGGYTEESVEDALNYEHDSLGWDDEHNNIYSDGQVLQGQGNNSGYIPMEKTNTFTDVEGQLISGYPQAFVQQKEAGGSDGKAGVTVSVPDVRLQDVVADKRYIPNPDISTVPSLLAGKANFGFENEDEKRILELLEADNSRSNTQKFLDRGRDLFGFRNTKKY